MARPKRQKRARMNLTLTQAAKARLDELVEQEPARSSSEIVSRALVLYGAALDAQREGGGVLLRRASGEVERVLLDW